MKFLTRIVLFVSSLFFQQGAFAVTQGVFEPSLNDLKLTFDHKSQTGSLNYTKQGQPLSLAFSFEEANRGYYLHFDPSEVFLTDLESQKTYFVRFLNKRDQEWRQSLSAFRLFFPLNTPESVRMIRDEKGKSQMALFREILTPQRLSSELAKADFEMTDEFINKVSNTDLIKSALLFSLMSAPVDIPAKKDLLDSKKHLLQQIRPLFYLMEDKGTITLHPREAFIKGGLFHQRDRRIRLQKQVAEITSCKSQFCIEQFLSIHQLMTIFPMKDFEKAAEELSQAKLHLEQYLATHFLSKKSHKKVLKNMSTFYDNLWKRHEIPVTMDNNTPLYKDRELTQSCGKESYMDFYVRIPKGTPVIVLEETKTAKRVALFDLFSNQLVNPLTKKSCLDKQTHQNWIPAKTNIQAATASLNNDRKPSSYTAPKSPEKTN